MPEARYDAIADWYDEYVGDGPGLGASLLPPALAGRRVLDLGCGQGRTCRHLATAGADVTGVDVSARLLEIAMARERQDPLGITFLHGDAGCSDWWDGRLFDGAVCDMALMDFDDLSAAVRTLAEVLRDGAWLVLALFHPCYPGAQGGPASWSADGGYFREGRWLPVDATGVRAAVGSHHRTLSTYLNTLRQHGFVLDVVAEPEVGEVPLLLLIRAVLDEGLRSGPDGG